MLGKLRILFEISLRNLFASKINLLIGFIVFGGTVMVVVGGSMLDSVYEAMSKSIRGSVAGDLQVFSAKSKDDLAIFGSMSGDPDLSPVPDFGKVYTSLSTVPNVKSVVPMGINNALVAGGNTVDLTLAELRGEIKKNGVASERATSLKEHVRQIVAVIGGDRKKLDELRAKSKDDIETDAALARAGTDEFWASFDKDPDGSLEFLENKVAPAVSDADLLFLQYVGTNMDEFAKSFDRVQIVDGTAVPKGRRGFLFNKLVYEDQVKLKSARRLDKIKEAKDTGTKIADDATLQRYVKENKGQTRELTLQLDPQETKKVVAGLQKAMTASDPTLDALLAKLFDITDDNFSERYKLYYEVLAPYLELYRVRVGDTLTLTGFSRSGYMQSVNVKIYGTFTFKGLEKAGLSGALNLIDLVSFRQLYGYLGSDKLDEIAEIKKAGGAKDIARDDAEAELFGGGSEIVAQTQGSKLDEAAKLAGGGERAAEQAALMTREYTRAEMNDGLVLNAAVILQDPTKVEETMAAIEAVSKKDGLDLKVLGWQKAAGFVGQMIFAARLLLYFAVFITFIVVLVIINNAVMMATMQRVREIGTLRAIGSQRNFVLSMIVTETVFLGVVFGGLGTLVGLGIMGLLGKVGIPASSDELYFFFSGPRLYPTWQVQNLAAGFIIVLFVSLISTLYPAFLAARISPLRAMQSDD